MISRSEFQRKYLIEVKSERWLCNAKYCLWIENCIVVVDEFCLAKNKKRSLNFSKVRLPAVAYILDIRTHLQSVRFALSHTHTHTEAHEKRTEKSHRARRYIKTTQANVEFNLRRFSVWKRKRKRQILFVQFSHIVSSSFRNACMRQMLCIAYAHHSIDIWQRL